MHTYSSPLRPATPGKLVRLALLATFVSGIAFASPAHAATDDQPTPSQQVADTAPVMQTQKSQAMAQHVEMRIKTLHDKLGITQAEETAWADVAQAMRDNESTISQLVEERRQNAESMSAVDDLQSYQNITQAHADGLKKLITAFQTVYEQMPDDQKKKADAVFGTFEGHHGGKPAKKHS